MQNESSRDAMKSRLDRIVRSMLGPVAFRESAEDPSGAARLVELSQSADSAKLAECVRVSLETSADMEAVTRIHAKGTRILGGKSFSMLVFRTASAAEPEAARNFVETAFNPSDSAGHELWASQVTSVALFMFILHSTRVAGMSAIEFVARILPESVISEIIADLERKSGD